jgi:hypothetical protein
VSVIASLRKVFDTGHQPMEQHFFEKGDRPKLNKCIGVQFDMKTLANGCHEASIPYPVEIKSFQRTRAPLSDTGVCKAEKVFQPIRRENMLNVINMSRK